MQAASALVPPGGYEPGFPGLSLSPVLRVRGHAEPAEQIREELPEQVAGLVPALELDGAEAEHLPAAQWQTSSLGFTGQCGSPTAPWVQENLPAGWGDTCDQYVAGQAFDITTSRMARITSRSSLIPKTDSLSWNCKSRSVAGA
jgi:hypothetical protein